jgi:hypothetical protein
MFSQEVSESNRELDLLTMTHMAHNHNGKLVSSENGTSGSIWVSFQFDNNGHREQFVHSLKTNNVGKLISTPANTRLCKVMF